MYSGNRSPTNSAHHPGQHLAIDRHHIRHQTLSPDLPTTTAAGHRRMRGQHRLDLTRLHPETTNLHLLIRTPSNTNSPSASTAAKSPVRYIRSPDTKRTRHKPLSRQPSTTHITPRQPAHQPHTTHPPHPAAPATDNHPAQTPAYSPPADPIGTTDPPHATSPADTITAASVGPYVFTNRRPTAHNPANSTPIASAPTTNVPTRPKLPRIQHTPTTTAPHSPHPHHDPHQPTQQPRITTLHHRRHHQPTTPHQRHPHIQHRRIKTQRRELQHPHTSTHTEHRTQHTPPHSPKHHATPPHPSATRRPRRINHIRRLSGTDPRDALNGDRQSRGNRSIEHIAGNMPAGTSRPLARDTPPRPGTSRQHELDPLRRIPRIHRQIRRHRPSTPPASPPSLHPPRQHNPTTDSGPTPRPTSSPASRSAARPTPHRSADTLTHHRDRIRSTHHLLREQPGTKPANGATPPPVPLRHHPPTLRLTQHVGTAPNRTPGSATTASNTRTNRSAIPDCHRVEQVGGDRHRPAHTARRRLRPRPRRPDRTSPVAVSESTSPAHPRPGKFEVRPRALFCRVSMTWNSGCRDIDGRRPAPRPTARTARPDARTPPGASRTRANLAKDGSPDRSVRKTTVLTKNPTRSSNASSSRPATADPTTMSVPAPSRDNSTANAACNTMNTVTPSRARQHAAAAHAPRPGREPAPSTPRCEATAGRGRSTGSASSSGAPASARRQYSTCRTAHCPDRRVTQQFPLPQRVIRVLHRQRRPPRATTAASAAYAVDRSRASGPIDQPSPAM